MTKHRISLVWVSDDSAATVKDFSLYTARALEKVLRGARVSVTVASEPDEPEADADAEPDADPPPA